MASRAFFRCRACGEPVVSGAYRCPVCGIDFPTGTPNAPTTPDSPAAVDPTSRSKPAAAANPVDIALRLEGALGEELRDPEPPAPAPHERSAGAELPRAASVDAEWTSDTPATPQSSEQEVWIDVGAGAGSRRSVDDTGTPSDPLVATDEDPNDEDPNDEARDGTSDEGVEDDAPDFDAATIVPSQARASAREAGSGLTVAPTATTKRPRRVVVAEPRTREIVVVPRRRNVSKDLGGTVVLALVVLVAIGGGAIYLEQKGLANFGLFQRAASTLLGGDTITVTAEDGWVPIPAEPGAVLINADGTYRIRLDGEVFTGTADQRVRVPMTSDTSLAVRTVRAPTEATVSRAP